MLCREMMDSHWNTSSGLQALLLLDLKKEFILKVETKTDPDGAVSLNSVAALS